MSRHFQEYLDLLFVFWCHVMVLTKSIPLTLSKYKWTESLSLPCKSAGMIWNIEQSSPHLVNVTVYMHHVA